MQARVLELISLGWTFVDIAQMTNSTPWAVRNHCWRMAKRLPEDFYPDLVGAKNARARLLMWFALSVASQQLQMVA